MRKTLCASILVLSLCGSVLAGDMGCPPIAPGDIPSPPSVSRSSSDQVTDGSGGTGAPATADDGIMHGDNAGSVATAALTVLNSMLALL